MERLTEYHCGVAVIKDKNLLKEAMAKLAAYEDAKEEGRLIVLPAPLDNVASVKFNNRVWINIPCNIGDTVYRITQNVYTKIKAIKICTVSRIAINNSEVQIFTKERYGQAIYGKTVFLTREEAEKALEEMIKSK